MRQKVLAILASVTFVAAMWVTLPPALRQYRRAVERRATAGERAAPRPAADALSSPNDPQAVATDAPAPAARATPAAPAAPATAEPPRGIKARVRTYLESHGMTGAVTAVQRMLRYLVDPRAWLWLAFFVLLERLIPAKPIQRLFSANKLMDFLYPVFNATVRGVVLVVGYGPVRAFYENYLPFLNLRLLDDVPYAVQGLGAFLAMDFAFWFSHWVRHKVPWLWHFHSVHHSQTELSPLTAWRAHPLEALFIYTLTLIPVGIVGGDRSTWIVVTILYGVAWPPFIHSNVKTNLGWLKYIIVSPQFHRVHHSTNPKQHDMNYGEHLIIWDWLFRTMEKDTEVYPDTGIGYGEFIEERSRTPWGLLVMWVKQCVYPFMMIGRSVGGALARATGRRD